MNEFDLYCRSKSVEGRRRLSSVRNLILSADPQLSECRIHFFLVFQVGGGVVAKLHLDAKEHPCITFVVGSELQDPAGLLKGNGLSRSIKIASDAYLAKHHDAIADLVRQAFDLVRVRWDGTTTLRTLRPDQPSP